jgi:hypothetical protein
LREVIHELENQLEAVTASPPEPAIPELEEEEDPEEIPGESKVESGPASPYVNLGYIVI